MKVQKLTLMLLTLIFLFTVINPSKYASVNAQTTVSTELKVANPLTEDENFIIHTTATVSGKRFNTTIFVQNIMDLYAWQIYLTYNSTLLNITNAWVPTEDPKYAFYGRTTFPSVNLSPERTPAGYGAALASDTILSGEKFTGAGKLLLLEFQILAAPTVEEALSSKLKISYPCGGELFETMWSQNGLTWQSFDVYTDGYYEYAHMLPPTPYLEISPSLNQYGLKSPAIGQQFDIVISIESLDHLWYLINATFSLNFNPSLISLVFNETHPMWKNKSVYLTPSSMLLHISVANPTINPSGSVTLISLKFQIEYQAVYPNINETTLELSDTKLIGYFQEIPSGPPVNSKVVIIGLLPKPWLEISPQNTTINKWAPPLAIGQEFNISVIIKNLDASWQLKNISFSLTFNQTLLKASNVTEGTFLPSFGTTSFNYTIFQDSVAINQFFMNSPSAFPYQEGTIANVTFTVLYQGSSLEIDESNITITEVELKDKYGNNIPEDSAKTVQGSYQIKSLSSSQISINITPSSVTIGSDVTISGGITPSRANANVTIYYRKQNETWAILKTVQTNQEGNYTFTWTADQAEKFEIKAKWAGDSDTQGSESDKITLTVEQGTQFPSTLIYAVAGITIGIVVIALAIYLTKKKR